MIRVGILLVFLATSAGAHHIMGIPHYAYDENYPQLPFVEITAQSGPWDLRLTYFPGIIQPGERIRFKLYGRHRETGEPLRVPLVGRVEQRAFLRAAAPVGEPFPIRVGKGPEGNDYKFFLSFPEHEAYQVRVRFPFPGLPAEEIPFPVDVGVTDDTPLFLLALGAFAGLVLYVRIQKRREQLS